MATPRQRPVALLTVISALALSGCGGISSGTAEKSADAIRAAETKLPSDYTYVLTSSCGERALLGTYEIAVAGADRVVSAKPADAKPADGKPADAKPADAETSPMATTDYPTIKALLESALGAGPKAEVEFEADAAGLPARLSIDPEPDASDDEECYRFAGITPGAPVPGRRSPG